MDYRPGGLEFHNSPHQLMAQMAEIPGGDYLHRSIDQLRSINERGLSAQIIHDYKQFSDLRNTIAVTDYTIKNNLNNNNNLIDNRNTAPSHNPSPDHHEQKHSHHQQQQQQQQYSSPSTPPTPLSITDAQMNDAKVKDSIFFCGQFCLLVLCISRLVNDWECLQGMYLRVRISANIIT